MFPLFSLIQPFEAGINLCAARTSVKKSVFSGYEAGRLALFELLPAGSPCEPNDEKHVAESQSGFDKARNKHSEEQVVQILLRP